MAAPDRKARGGGSFAFTSFEPRPVVAEPALPATARPPDLPGCESFHLPESALDAYDGHLEFWDGSSETAWRVRETSTWHERPTRRLSGLVERIAALRGSGILCLGSADLLRTDGVGRKRWIMQADEILYLHRDRAQGLGSAVIIGEDPLPDVVLEVDHSTDARRWKLGVYQECGFPEIWVEVPWDVSVRRPGLAIHVRRGDGYRGAEESLAFPGWTAAEIHRALTEEPLSAESWRSLERVALAMGAHEGTTPEDDPLTRSMSRRAAAQGHAEGRRQGHAEGLRQGHAEGLRQGNAEGLAAARAQAVTAALRARGVDAPADVVADDVARRADLPLDTLVAAAVTCTNLSDFRRRLREMPVTDPPPDSP